MAAATVICGICNKTVSKRASLSIGDSRICRTHQEATDFVALQARQKSDSERERSESVAFIVNMVRMSNTLGSVITPRVLKDGLRGDRALLYDDVVKELDANGWRSSARDFARSVGMLLQRGIEERGDGTAD